MQTFWRRSDGTMASREFLMMTLADLSFIMIKAKYTEDVAETRFDTDFSKPLTNIRVN